MSEDASTTSDAPADAEPQTGAPQSVVEPDTGDDAVEALRDQLEAALKEAEKWKATSRKHEGRAKENADAATKAKSVEERLAETEKRLAEREAADAERSGRLAVTRVQAKLATAGFNPSDVDGLLSLIDPKSLLVNGEPDDKAIDKLTESLVKVGGRTTPDRDQGQRGGSAPQDMNGWIRRKAGLAS